MEELEQRAVFEDTVVALDASISMRGKEFEPSKFEAAKLALKRFVEVRLGSHPMDRIGLLVFYGYAVPVADLTEERETLLSLIQKLTVLGEATNLGDAIITGTRMFAAAQSREFERRVLVITDGTFNQGPDPAAASLYALSKRVRVDFVLLGRLGQDDAAVVEKCTQLTDGSSSYALDADELMAKLVAYAEKSESVARR